MLQQDIDNGDGRLKTLLAKIIKQMSGYCKEYKTETQEVDASIEALEDYRRMLAGLKDDDLPRFETRFKQELNEKTIQSLVHFSTQLERSETELKARIGRINQSMTTIDYNEGSYIQLLAENINDADIRQFRHDLRACLSESLAEELYDEDRFLQVKAIIERFRRREGKSEADERWTRKVTDVRNWFVFSAEELWREDNSRRDYFESSSGKSGGQKEKLAYTILASALAYQFGPDKADNIRSFRFVVIDEAFGRGSDTSTRYALTLFRKLGLQLLVVTPLRKIHVIEPFIHHVHFIHNEDGKNSQIRNMTIEEYQEEKTKHQIHADRQRDPEKSATPMARIFGKHHYRRDTLPLQDPVGTTQKHGYRPPV
ncbi:MAG: SbcC/MukB-like Walker B domain-containing protein [Proteobacteria bacterium]|nr:SbcC/MukB-like Walker B domain-containing protein [Pseudomonadota bacterium]